VQVRYIQTLFEREPQQNPYEGPEVWGIRRNLSLHPYSVPPFPHAIVGSDCFAFDTLAHTHEVLVAYRYM